MSIKKDIVAAVASENSVVKINKIAHLVRYKKDMVGYHADTLYISFDYIGGVRGGWRKDIFSRDYDGIVREICAATSEYFAMCADAINKNFLNGYM